MSAKASLPVNYCPEHGDLLERTRFGRDTRSFRCTQAHTLGEIFSLAGAEPLDSEPAMDGLPVAVNADPFPWRDPAGKVQVASQGWLNHRRLIHDPRIEYASTQWRPLPTLNGEISE